MTQRPEPGRGRGPGRLGRKVLLGVGATVAAGALGYAGARHATRRARARPDPERGEDLAERPGRERRVRSFDGTELAVHVAGPRSAPALVLVHGFSGDLTLWHYQWKHFSANHRCILFDQRGHGRSGPAAGANYSLEALGRDLRAILDAEAPSGPVALIGHSMGGMAVLAFADLFPEEFGSRVASIVLANTAAAELVRAMVGGLGTRAASLLTAAALRLVSKPDRVYRVRARALAGRGGLAFAATRLTNFGPGAPPSIIEYVASVGARAPVEAWTNLLASLVDMDLRHALDAVTVPALIIAGEVDRLTPPASARALERRLPTARLVVFQGAGHCTMLERHETFNRMVEDFLREVASRSEQQAPA